MNTFILLIAFAIVFGGIGYIIIDTMNSFDRKVK
jgi:hypothetical protein